jgi:hypothetical protein
VVTEEDPQHQILPQIKTPLRVLQKITSQAPWLSRNDALQNLIRPSRDPSCPMFLNSRLIDEDLRCKIAFPETVAPYPVIEGLQHHLLGCLIMPLDLRLLCPPLIYKKMPVPSSHLLHPGYTLGWPLLVLRSGRVNICQQVLLPHSGSTLTSESPQ